MNRCYVIAGLFALAIAATRSWAEQTVPRGVDIFDAACAGCHESGEHGAPKIGDRAAWRKRSAQGLANLAQHALDGVCNIPPRAGDVGLSDLEIKRAIVYMVNNSGGKWVEPATEGECNGKRSAAEIVQTQCAYCHAIGFSGAPRIGDRAAWTPRLKLGINRAVRSAAQGHRDMPPRGGLPRLSEAQIRSAVIFMASAPRAPASGPTAVAAPSSACK